MTYLSYPAAPGYGIWLHHLHANLLQGGKTKAEALEWVAWAMHHNTIEPPIPPGSEPSLGPRDGPHRH
jgi:hypothetical protein